MIHYYNYRVEVVRNGARYTDLDFIDKPTIDARLTAQVKMSFSATFRYDPAVDYLTDRLRLYLSVDGAEEPVGDFCVATTSRSTTDTGGDRIKVEAYDRHGDLYEYEGEGLFARAVFHETDHLDGKVYLRLVTEPPADLKE